MIGTVTEGTVAVGDEVKFEIERGRKTILPATIQQPTCCMQL